MAPLASIGFRVIAPDMRGFGKSDSPDRADAFSLFHLVGDMVSLVEAMGETNAVIVGHDWGAIVAWTAALLRPDRFRAVAGLSVPYTPRGSSSITKRLRDQGRDESYLLYFQNEGVAEAELERDIRSSLRRIYHSASADVGPDYWSMSTTGSKRAEGILGGASEPATSPDWLTADDLTTFADAFSRSGFRGGLNWYRNIDRNRELLSPWHECLIMQPSLYIVGKRDNILATMPARALDRHITSALPGLRDKIFLDDCGHWVQQEKHAEVTAALVNFVKSLPD